VAPRATAIAILLTAIRKRKKNFTIAVVPSNPESVTDIRRFLVRGFQLNKNGNQYKVCGPLLPEKEVVSSRGAFLRGDV
jgi:hypothetical protein